MAVSAARHTTYHASFLTVWHCCSSSHTCRGSSCTESGRLCCMARLMAKDYVQVQKHAPVVVAPVQHVVMRLSVASHKGKLSPASWAMRGPLLPPHRAGVGATKLHLFSHGSLHTWRTRGAFVMARGVGRVSSCGWVGAARVIADSAHCCQASILAVWLGCMRKSVAARTVKVEELRLSGPGDDCIAPCWCCWCCWCCWRLCWYCNDQCRAILFIC